jgi:hypothetical protein
VLSGVFCNERLEILCHRASLRRFARLSSPPAL